MGRNLVRQFFEMLMTIMGLILISFIILKLLPGSPFDDEASLNPLIKTHLEQELGLHQPILNQLLKYIGSVLKGDLGESMIHPGETVIDILIQTFSITLKLNLSAFVVVIFGAFILSTFLVLINSVSIVALIEVFVLALVSLPSLFLGPLLIYIFAIYWDILPAAQLNSSSSYILPIIALSLRPMAYLTRLLSRSWRSQLNEDYMQLAMAKGLSYKQAIVKHALRNSLVPVVSYLGPLAVGLLSGSFLVELLFAIPGLGTSFIRSVENRDYPIVLGLTLFFGIGFIVTSFLIDLINKKLDPRWVK